MINFSLRLVCKIDCLALFYFFFLVEMSLKFMLEIEDDEEWSITDDIGEDEDSGR